MLKVLLFYETGGLKPKASRELSPGFRLFADCIVFLRVRESGYKTLVPEAACLFIPTLVPTEDVGGLLGYYPTAVPGFSLEPYSIEFAVLCRA